MLTYAPTLFLPPNKELLLAQEKSTPRLCLYSAVPGLSGAFLISLCPFSRGSSPRRFLTLEQRAGSAQLLPLGFGTRVTRKVELFQPTPALLLQPDQGHGASPRVCCLFFFSFFCSKEQKLSGHGRSFPLRLLSEIPVWARTNDAVPVGGEGALWQSQGRGGLEPHLVPGCWENDPSESRNEDVSSPIRR